jgi:hypothetical protein
LNKPGVFAPGMDSIQGMIYGVSPIGKRGVDYHFFPPLTTDQTKKIYFFYTKKKRKKQ